MVMKQRIFPRIVLLLGLLALCADIVAQTALTASKPIPAGNVAKLRENVGQEVTVQGRIGSTGRSKSGNQFLNFANSELTAVCFSEHVTKFRDGKPADVYRGKEVELTGKVELFRDEVQIRLTDPSQIRIVAAAEVPEPKGIELKQIGEETWLSPAGLRYHGRDPEGRTRVEHVCRHLADMPRREGSHGVFDGGRSVALAVIDEAWQLARTRHLRPQREGDRSSYTVDMGRRIGFLGGRTGALKAPSSAAARVHCFHHWHK